MKNKRDRRVTRVQLDEGIKVVLCSIGSQTTFDLMTRDISISGFFIEYDSPARFPCSPSDVLEIWLQLTETEQVFFNGQVARRVFSREDTGADPAGIAIKIVKVDEKNERILASFIHDKGLEIHKNSEIVA